MRERVRHIMPEELETAIEHAMKTHHMAEQERARFRDATDVEEFRAILRDVGVPDIDIDISLSTLPKVLEARAREKEQAIASRRQRRRLVIGGLAAVVALAAVVTPFLFSSRPAPPVVAPAPPVARRIAPARVVEPTPMEKALPLVQADPKHDAAEALRALGVTVLESLSPDEIVAISEGRASPLTELFKGVVPEEAFVVTRGDCRAKNLADLLDDPRAAMFSVKASVEVLRVNVATGRRLGSAKGERTAMHIDEVAACRKGTAEAAGLVAKQLGVGGK